jgi:hypothetical protein
VNDAYLGDEVKGCVFPIYGGDLRGDWCLWGRRQRYEAISESSISKVGELASAQCAIVMSADGRIGFSWSTEFLPRYSHSVHFLESMAVWQTVLGWTYADIVRLDSVEPVLQHVRDCRLVQEASGEHVRWWVGDEYAVYAEPRAASPTDKPLNISVLARTTQNAHAMKKVLSSEVHGHRPDYLLGTLVSIGENFPMPPSSWGVLTSAREFIASRRHQSENYCSGHG